MLQSRLFGGVLGTSVLGAKLKQNSDDVKESQNVPRKTRFLNQMQKSKQLKKSSNVNGISSTLATGGRLLSAAMSRKVAQCQEAASQAQNEDTGDADSESRNNPNGNMNRFRNASQISGGEENEAKKKKKKKKVVAAAIEDEPDSEGDNGTGLSVDLSADIDKNEMPRRQKSIKVSHPNKVDENAPSRDIETVEPVSNRPMRQVSTRSKGDSDFHTQAAARTRIHKGKLFPVYSKAEVGMMASDNRVVISYDDGVYDVTQFAHHHPGGPMIMMANGGPVEYFWATYRCHFKRGVYEVLEKFRIGVLAEDDQVKSYDELENPFKDEPIRHPGIMPLSHTPFDGETPLMYLARTYYTPNNIFYIRNHHQCPRIDPDEHEVCISVPPELGGSSDDGTNFKLEDLNELPQHDLTATLFCTGFRAKQFSKASDDADGGQCGNAKWSGVRLRDVFRKCGFDQEKMNDLEDKGMYYHVILQGEDGYEVSIPLTTAARLQRDVMIVTKMNGQDLPRDHGYPMRVMIPGYVGARWVKWVKEITISETPSESPFQTHMYRMWPSTVHSHEQVHDADLEIRPIYEAPVNSMILSPAGNDVVELHKEDETVRVSGVAIPAGGHAIAKMEVFAGGEWHEVPEKNFQKDKQPPGRCWAWMMWSIDIPREWLHPDSDGKVTLACRATGDNYATQDNSGDVSNWNMRGYLNNRYHTVAFTVHNM